MLIGMRHAKVEADLVEKVGFGQGHIFGGEVTFDIKNEAISSLLEAVVVVQRAVGIATVVVEVERFDQGGLTVVGGVQRHLHACGGPTVHGV